MIELVLGALSLLGHLVLRPFGLERRLGHGYPVTTLLVGIALMALLVWILLG